LRSASRVPHSAVSYDLNRLRPALRPFRLHWFPTVGSTNTHAALLRRRGTLYAPAVVLTGRQTAGRGRGSNLWWSPRGCLTTTFVWPIESQLQPQHLPLIVGIAIRRAAVAITGDATIELKWPNDLLYHDRKLAGLLCERIDRCDLIGLGLNVCPDLAAMPKGLRDKVTSLSAIAGRPIDVTETLITIAHHLHDLLSRSTEQNFPTLLEEYDRHHALIGRTVSIVTGKDDPAVTGIVKGLDDTGRLLLKTPGGMERILSGQVNLRER